MLYLLEIINFYGEIHHLKTQEYKILIKQLKRRD